MSIFHATKFAWKQIIFSAFFGHVRIECKRSNIYQYEKMSPFPILTNILKIDIFRLGPAEFPISTTFSDSELAANIMKL